MPNLSELVQIDFRFDTWKAGWPHFGVTANRLAKGEYDLSSKAPQWQQMTSLCLFTPCETFAASHQLSHKAPTNL